MENPARACPPTRQLDMQHAINAVYLHLNLKILGVTSTIRLLWSSLSTYSSPSWNPEAVYHRWGHDRSARSHLAKPFRVPSRFAFFAVVMSQSTGLGSSHTDILLLARGCKPSQAPSKRCRHGARRYAAQVRSWSPQWCEVILIPLPDSCKCSTLDSGSRIDQVTTKDLFTGA